MLKNPQHVQNLLKKDRAYSFLKNIRGSPPYWQKMFYEVLAMIQTLGIPTWFLTLSAADMKWPKVIQSIAQQYGTIYTENEVLALPWQMKSKWLRSNPVTAARMFQYRLETFEHYNFSEEQCKSYWMCNRICDSHRISSQRKSTCTYFVLD